eukprot:2735247-Pyramimonas_sp.AAC.1
MRLLDPAAPPPAGPPGLAAAFGEGLAAGWKLAVGAKEEQWQLGYCGVALTDVPLWGEQWMQSYLEERE